MNKANEKLNHMIIANKSLFHFTLGKIFSLHYYQILNLHTISSQIVFLKDFLLKKLYSDRF